MSIMVAKTVAQNGIPIGPVTKLCRTPATRNSLKDAPTVLEIRK